MLIRTRMVLPGNRPPIEDAAVAIAHGRVLSVGKWSRVRRHTGGRHLDLGETLVLPGLVNAHCHLDYTAMAGLIPPMRSFTDWIKSITALKGTWSDAEFVSSWKSGADMLLHSGTTTVADVEAVPNLLPDLWKTTPLRVISFLEMTGVRSRRDPRQILAETASRARRLRGRGTGIGLSPHALYSTTPALLRLSLQAARRHDWRLVTHVAESLEEFDMIRHARGPMFDWLRRNERDMADCGRCSPVAQLERLGYLNRRLLAVHLNYLTPGDARLLARGGAHAVHCPRSHDYFRHQPFPYSRLVRAGVNVCLGTDSLVTVRKARHEAIALDLFAEMRAFARAHPAVPAADILALVTHNPGRALGLGGRVGTLRAGAAADLIVLPYAGTTSEAAEAAVHHQGAVSASLIGGAWAIPPVDTRP
ncbi:MAG: amidohydrolase family protein [Verrucomicrobia bacterium]|nr:amidohydrolase family protein [Verrucomicrobiota bacterium]